MLFSHCFSGGNHNIPTDGAKRAKFPTISAKSALFCRSLSKENHKNWDKAGDREQSSHNILLCTAVLK